MERNKLQESLPKLTLLFFLNYNREKNKDGDTMSTLYISDLDGTLLNKNAKLSEVSKKLLLDLIHKNVLFTCATARTMATVSHLLKDIPLSAPAILMNGVAILDWNTKKYIKVEYYNQSFCSILLDKLSELSLTGFLYCIDDDKLCTYYENLYNESMIHFYEERVNLYQKPFTKVNSFHEIDANKLIYTLLLDTKEALSPLIEWLTKNKEQFEIDFCCYPEIYLENTWCLEIFHKNASKYNAVMYLRRNYPFDKIVGFGDNLNDLSLFLACDETYAVSNAKPEVIESATAVIGSNTEDSVPKFIATLENL